MLKMKNQLSVICFVLLFIQNISSQETEKSEEEKDFIYMMTYEMTKELFKKSDYFYKSQKLEIDKNLIKSINSKETIISSIDSLDQNAKVFLKDGRAKYIVLESKFPSYFEPEKLDIISIKLSKNQLINKNNEVLNHINAESTSFSGLEVIKENQLDFSVQIDDKVSGTVSYQVKFITDYAIQKVSKNDIGSIIKLNNNEYELIEIFDNKIVLKPNLNENLTLSEINIRCINLDETGGNEFIPYSYKELKVLEQKDPKYKNAKTLASSISLIDENIYNQFKQNKDLDIERFKKEISIKKLLDKTISGKYIIIETIAPLNNDVIFYEPIYGVNKIIRVEL